MRLSTQAILVLLPASAILAQTPAPSFKEVDAGKRQELLNQTQDQPLARSAAAARQGFVPTNTLAFRDYALDLLLAVANETAEKWTLEAPRPITVDQVTRFYAVPRITGADASITLNERFSFAVQEGRFERFRDLHYWSGSWQDITRPPSSWTGSTNRQQRMPLSMEEAYQRAFREDSFRAQSYHAKMMQLSKSTNLLTKETALQLAQEALVKLGFTPKQLGLVDLPEVNQFTYQAEGGKSPLPLPLFSVAWRFQNSDLQPVVMEVSGITKTLVSYFNVAPDARIIPVPTNYFTMLGVPPEPRLWGKQYGYDPLNTDAFQLFARDFLLEKAKWLNRTWKLGLSPAITTNQLDHFQAIPHTNTFLASARIASRFEFQIGDGMIQIFKDYRQGSDAFTGSKQKMASVLKEENQLTRSSALTLARERLAQIGIDEKKLRLPKPLVRQVREPFPDEEQLRDLPFFSIQWKWSDAEDEYAVMAMELSGITKQVTFFANSCTNTPHFSLPPQYNEILGLK